VNRPHPLVAIRSRAAATPLRVKLVASVLLIAAVGLTATALVATTALHTYLLDRVDSQLQSFARPAAGRFGGDGGVGAPRGPDGGDGQRRLPSDFYVRVYDAAGAPDGSLSQPLIRRSPPKLPVLTEARAASGAPFTVMSVDGRSSWRVVTRVRSDGPGSIAVAIPLSDVNHTVDRLVVLEGGIGAIVLVFMGLSGYVLILRSLRPLVEVEHTAAAIAAGDLSRRVAAQHPRTEVGRLSAALNGMLTRIEDAFDHERTSQQQARASEERMRRFVADASHELRTPLTSIRGFAELYRMGAAGSGADVRRLMRRVEDEAARMGLLVEDLLLLARLDQQRPLQHEPVDVLDLARDIVHDAQVVAPERQIELTADVPVPAQVLGDDMRLRQVLHNLVTNALSHTPGGTPVTVRVAIEGPAAARSVVVEVADRGPGLSREDADRVFERFYRVDTSRTRQAGGSGLGLSIVAGLVAAHDGVVSVSGRDGGGAVFRVELPLLTQRGRSRPNAPASSVTAG
jgi:two-component system OmpR family sensor kinase